MPKELEASKKGRGSFSRDPGIRSGGATRVGACRMLHTDFREGFFYALGCIDLP